MSHILETLTAGIPLMAGSLSLPAEPQDSNSQYEQSLTDAFMVMGDI